MQDDTFEVEVKVDEKTRQVVLLADSATGEKYTIALSEEIEHDLYAVLHNRRIKRRRGQQP